MSFRVFCPKLAEKWPLKWAKANSKNFHFCQITTPPLIRGADKENDSKHISSLSFFSNSRSNVLVVFIDGSIQDYCICIFIAQVLVHYLKCHYFSISSPQIFSIPSFPRKNVRKSTYIKLTHVYFHETIFFSALVRARGRWVWGIGDLAFKSKIH